jgi:hypothetical protein
VGALPGNQVWRMQRRFSEQIIRTHGYLYHTVYFTHVLYLYADSAPGPDWECQQFQYKGKAEPPAKVFEIFLFHFSDLSSDILLHYDQNYAEKSQEWCGERLVFVLDDIGWAFDRVAIDGLFDDIVV